LAASQLPCHTGAARNATEKDNEQAMSMTLIIVLALAVLAIAILIADRLEFMSVFRRKR